MGQRIEICAPMALGKTTLVDALAKRGFNPFHELELNNPHLEAFYASFSPEAAFNKDNWFLEAQSAQMRRANAMDGVSILDYGSTLSRGYIRAGRHTPDNEAQLLEKWSATLREVGEPDLLIVMRLPVEEQARRLQARMRPGEEAVPRSYLETLKHAVEHELSQLPPSANILEVDAMRDFRKPFEADKLAREVTSALGIRSSRQVA